MRSCHGTRMLLRESARAVIFRCIRGLYVLLIINLLYISLYLYETRSFPQRDCSQLEYLLGSINPMNRAGYECLLSLSKLQK